MTPLLRRPRPYALVAAGLVIVLVFTATGLGLRLPGLGFLSPVREEALGYESIRGERFSPLRDAFVSRILGTGGHAAFSDSAGDRGVWTATPSGTVLRHGLTNDNFASALVVPGVPFTATTDTQAATREQGEPSACAPTGGTVWYRYTPQAGVRLAADTFGSNYAIALGVFSGTSLNNLTSIGCDSNVSGDAQVIFTATALRTYYVQITGLVGGGNLVFNLSRRGRTLLASGAGAPADGDSGAGTHQTSNNVVSADGRYVAFPSSADNLVPGDTNGQFDVFVKDRVTGRVTRASVSSSGEQGVDGTYPRGADSQSTPAAPQRTVTSLSISADGRYVAFLSYDTNLVPGDTNGRPGNSSNPSGGGEDAFVHDMRTGRTTRVSVTSSGKQGTRRATGSPTAYASDGCCAGTAISADGRYVAFTSFWEDLVPGDTNNYPDVFVHDMRTGETTRVSGDTGGGYDQQYGAVYPFMSGDGRYVGFAGLAVAPYCCSEQVFVDDVRTKRTGLASFTRSHSIPNGPSGWGSISGDGRYVAYESNASDIVSGDDNNLLDAFRADLRNRTVIRVSVDSQGRQQTAPQGSDSTGVGNLTPSSDPLPNISGDGRFVAFTSPASNLVPNDTNGAVDVFVHDTLTGRTVRASVSTGGQQGNANSVEGVLSGNGSVAVFSSLATNLVSDDNNGYSDVFVRELVHR